MNRPEFVSAVYLRATGKPTAPTSGRKYDQIIALGEFFTRQWQDEPGQDWASLYDFRNSGTVSATDTFALTATIRKVSQMDGDKVRILHTDSNETEYTIVPADRLYEYRYDFAVAVTGTNLMFSSAFTADSPQFGGTIIVPSYGYAEFPTNDTDLIEVDNPDWLVLRTAAEFVRTDITRQNQYPNLINEAQQLMDKMKENDGGQVDTIYRPNFFTTSDDVEW